jgi:hypothetical protein
MPQLHRRRLELGEPDFDEPMAAPSRPQPPPDVLAQLLRLDPLVASLSAVYQAAVTAEATPIPPPLASTFEDAHTELLLDQKLRPQPVSRVVRPSTSSMILPAAEPPRSLYLYQMPPAELAPGAPVRRLAEPDSILPPWQRKELPTVPLEVDHRDYLFTPSLADGQLYATAMAKPSYTRSADAYLMGVSRPLSQQIPLQGVRAHRVSLLLSMLLTLSPLLLGAVPLSAALCRGLCAQSQHTAATCASLAATRPDVRDALH